jgi:hypothetical protein
MFDFYKEFLGVDIAKVEQIGELIGRVTAVLYKAMVSNGLSEDEARAILKDAESAFFKAIMSSASQETK